MVLNLSLTAAGGTEISSLCSDRTVKILKDKDNITNIEGKLRIFARPVLYLGCVNSYLITVSDASSMLTEIRQHACYVAIFAMHTAN